MLLSDKLKLLAAYDHRHVFIDPDPDPAASFAERRRLFDTPGSSWDDYSREVLSEGGGVFPRDAKWMDLSPRARELLGLEDERLAPNEVIRAILRAQVDLLWNGGIGTVVKASTESDADAHDRASDAIRVDAKDLRCRVVGEGGNLGFTRRARVEFSAGGGRIYADFIDNSAGVDCSDHEVNLKILLGLAERRGEMTRARARRAAGGGHRGRRRSTCSTTRSCRRRSSPRRSTARPGGCSPTRTCWRCSRSAGCSTAPARACRATTSSPSAGGPGAGSSGRSCRSCSPTRSGSSRASSSGPATPTTRGSSATCAPTSRPPSSSAAGTCSASIQLRTQLICMINANAVVNALGPTFVSTLVSERGWEVAEIVRAFRIAVEVTGADALWEAIEDLEGADRAAQMELLGGVDGLVESTARWYLTWAPGAGLEETIAAGRDGFDRLAAVLPKLGTEERRSARAQTVDGWSSDGVPVEVAEAHALRAELVHAPDMVAVAASSGRSIEDVARVFFALGGELRLDWMERELSRVRSATRMQRWALQAVREDAFKARRELASAALAGSSSTDPVVACEQFLHDNAAASRRLESFLRTLSREGDTDLAGLALAVRQLDSLVS